MKKKLMRYLFMTLLKIILKTESVFFFFSHSFFLKYISLQISNKSKYVNQFYKFPASRVKNKIYHERDKVYIIQDIFHIFQHSEPFFLTNSTSISFVKIYMHVQILVSRGFFLFVLGQIF